MEGENWDMGIAVKGGLMLKVGYGIWEREEDGLKSCGFVNRVLVELGNYFTFVCEWGGVWVAYQCKNPARKWHIWFFPKHEPTLCKNLKSHFLLMHQLRFDIKNHLNRLKKI
jgi:hypothetical protein